VRNETALAKATREVRSKFSTKEDVRTGAALSSCTYLRACIDEAMRLCPPVPAVLSREVLHGGLTVNGHYFPEGTDVGVPPFAVMRNPLYYSDPLKYKPERWLECESTTAESIKLVQSAFCPFSIGPRVCLAKSLAYAELMVVTSRVLWEFDIRAVPGSRLGEDADGNIAFRDVFATKMEGPLVQVRKRTVDI
jgi:cytochrome P450